MSSLPEGASLTSIDGRRCTAVPRNVSGTIDNGIPFRPTNPPSPVPKDQPLGGLPITSIGGLLRERPPNGSIPSSVAPSAPTTPSPRIFPSVEKSILPIATTAPQSQVSEPETSQEPTGDEQPPAEDVPVSTTDAGSQPTSVADDPSGGVFVPSSAEGSGDASTQLRNAPSSTGEVQESRTGDPASNGVPEETFSPNDNVQSDGTNPTGADAFITSTLSNGAVTSIPTEAFPSDDDSTPAATSGPNSDAIGSSDHGNHSRNAGVIAGSVVGALAGVALIAFLIWFWRKRSQKKHKYTIQTPVFDPPPTGRTEKTWEFDSGSVGPTPRSARLVEAVGYKVMALGKMFKMSSPTQIPPSARESRVNMNRGNSQFLDIPPPPTMTARQDPDTGTGVELSAKDRLGDWWTRVREDASFNRRVRNESTTEIGFTGGASMARGAASGMPHGRRSSDGSAYRSSAALLPTMDHPQSRGLNPFSDANAVHAQHRQPTQQQQQPSHPNPFHDTYQALPQTTYDPRAVQRPRGSSTASILRHHNNSTPLSRNNVRSDQFDLEIDPHPGSRVRTDSFTSRVSTISTDVGPAALRWADDPGRPGQAF